MGLLQMHLPSSPWPILGHALLTRDEGALSRMRKWPNRSRVEPDLHVLKRLIERRFKILCEWMECVSCDELVTGPGCFTAPRPGDPHHTPMTLMRNNQQFTEDGWIHSHTKMTIAGKFLHQMTHIYVLNWNCWVENAGWLKKAHLASDIASTFQTSQSHVTHVSVCEWRWCSW